MTLSFMIPWWQVFLGRGWKWALWMSPCHPGVTIQCVNVCNMISSVLPGATGCTCFTLCKDERGKERPVWCSVGHVGWGTTPALSNTPAVSLNKRHSLCGSTCSMRATALPAKSWGRWSHTRGDVWGCVHSASISPSSQAVSAVVAAGPNSCSGERVYPCSIRTDQSTWDKCTLSIKGYLKLIEIEPGHLPGTMTNPLHPLCREPRSCTFPLQVFYSLSWLIITDFDEVGTMNTAQRCSQVF